MADTERSPLRSSWEVEDGYATLKNYRAMLRSEAKEILAAAEDGDGVVDGEKVGEMILQNADSSTIYYGASVAIMVHTDNDDYAFDHGLLEASNFEGNKTGEIVRKIAMWAYVGDLTDMMRRVAREADVEF